MKPHKLLVTQLPIIVVSLQMFCHDSCRYPMLCMGLAEVVDISAASICLTSLSLLFASVSYAVLRFDQLQRATLELALASEAICLQAHVV